MEYVIFCAGMGTRLGMGLPKCLVEVNGKTILEHQLSAIQQCDGSSIVHVIAGYKFLEVRKKILGMDIDQEKVNLICNPFFKCAGIIGTAWMSLSSISSDSIIRIDGDCLFDSLFINQILNINKSKSIFFVNSCNKPSETAIINFDNKNRLKNIELLSSYVGKKEWTCVEIYHNYEFQEIVENAWSLVENGNHYYVAVNNYYTQKELCDRPIVCHCVGTVEVDTIEDLNRAKEVFSG